MITRIVYVLANPSIPGLVKVGATWQAGDVGAGKVADDPLPGFRCVYAGKVSSRSQVLCRFDDCFGRYRTDPSSRLYSITEKQAISLLALLVSEEIVPDQFVLGQSAKPAECSEEAEIDLDGDERLLRSLLDGSVVDESSLFDSYLLDHEHEIEAELLASYIQWMKKFETRSLAHDLIHEEEDVGRDSDSGDPYFEDAQAREWEERAGYFRYEAMGDRSTDDIDASDHEYYEALSEDAEIRALAEEERYVEQMLSEELQERSVDQDGFATNPDGPSGEDDPHLDDPCYSWEAEEYEEQKRQLHDE